MTNKLKEAWRVRSNKEKRLLLLSGVVVVLAVIYHGVYKPLNDSINHTQVSLKNDIQLLEWMKRESPRVLAARQGGKPSFEGSLFALVERRFKALEEQPRITRENENTVSVSFNQVPFDGLIATLQTLMNQEGVTIEAFRASSSEESGLVQASMKLTR